jgi:ABC-2 type transport system permease protein
MTNAGEKNNSAARNGRLARQAFWAMVQRDLLIQARDAWEFVFRVAMLPFILILTYGFVLPISLIFMGSRIDVTMGAGGILPLALVLVLISLASAALGLLVGTIVKPNQIAAMFPGFLMPVVFLGAIFFSWQSLSAIPVLQAIVLVNPLVYANEALRAILTPQITHMPLVFSVFGLVAAIVIMGGLGFRRFHRMVVGQKA